MTRTAKLLGSCWEGDDSLKELAPAEEGEVLNLAAEASKRLAVPYNGI